jgi:hypothetical protein
MGFVTSFLRLPERHAILELVDQHLFDLFSHPAAVEALRRLADSSPVSDPGAR